MRRDVPRRPQPPRGAAYPSGSQLRPHEPRGGCAVIVGVSANEAVESIEEEFNASAITLDEYRSVENGARRSEVVDQLGEPADQQEFESSMPELDIKSVGSCIYYNREGGDLGDLFQFCFQDGRLTSKSAY